MIVGVLGFPGPDRIRLIAINMKGAFGNEGALRIFPTFSKHSARLFNV